MELLTGVLERIDQRTLNDCFLGYSLPPRDLPESTRLVVDLGILGFSFEPDEFQHPRAIVARRAV